MLRQNIIILTTESYQETKAGVIYSKGGVVLKCEVLFTSTCVFFFFKGSKNIPGNPCLIESHNIIR